MVKKQQKTVKAAKSAKAPAAPRKSDAPATPFAEQVRSSAQQIWSAGLAAFAKAQDQGGAMIDKLSAEGAKVEQAAHRMSDMAGEVGTRAGQHWDKLESIFEDRVARALARLGMPAAEEVAQLQARVEALSAEVAMLRAAKTPAAPTAPSKKIPTKKAPPKQAVAAKSAAAKTASPGRASAAKKPTAKKVAKPAKGRARTS